jgi:tripartite-type tricarboxylate transporter receptor subunit TctC
MEASMKKLALAFLFFVSTSVLAWQPTKPIIVVFPNGPGAGNEISFRMVSSIVEKKTGASFVAEHKPGVDGNIAMNYFNTLPADGYYVAVPACQSNYVTQDIWYSNMVKYNAMDFEPVANIGRSPLAFWSGVGSTINTPQDLVNAIKKKDRPLQFAIGGSGHKLAVEYLTTSLNVPGDRVETIMYKGPAQALQDVLGGHVEFGVTPVGVGLPLYKAGKIKLIGIANEHPIKGLEKAPLMKDYAAGLNIHGCWNLVLPPKTPDDVQAWYRKNFIPALESQELKARYEENLMFITPNELSSEGVRASMVRLRQVWQPIARKIKPE